MERIIAIADCNNFYVSCERLFNPKVAKVPTVVLTNNDGSAISRSQEAKDLGIGKGENMFHLKTTKSEIFSQIKQFSSNYTLYADISDRVVQAIKLMVPTVEVYSIDEVFLDLTHIQPDKVVEFMREIKDNVLKWTGIPISIGASSTKTLAKLANRVSKKGEGVYFISEPKKFLIENRHQIDFEDIWGIGTKGSRKIQALGCKDIVDFVNLDPQRARKALTVTGLRTQTELNGIRCFDVETDFKERKNVSSSRTFGYQVSDLDHLQKATQLYVQKACEKLISSEMLAGKVRLSVANDRHKDGFGYHRTFELALSDYSNDPEEIWAQVQKVLVAKYDKRIRYRKSGIIFQDLVPKVFKQSKIFKEIHKPISFKEPNSDKWVMRREFLSRKFTTQWLEIPIVKRIKV
jgi:DNA polymerase V